MLKKGEQIIVINDPTQAPIKFYHKRAGSEPGIFSQQAGLGYPNNGTYVPVTGDNVDIGAAPTYVITAGSETNWERMSINGFNVNIDALRVLRASKYAAVAEQVEQAALTVTTPAAAVGSFITVELTLTCLDKYLSEFNTVFADGNIKIIRDFKVATNTNAGITAAIAEQFNNVQMRLNNENPTMNVVALAGVSGVGGTPKETVTFKTANSGITISNITITETPASGLPALVATYVPAKTALDTTFTSIVQNQVGFAGRGIYNIMRNDFPQTAYKIYPYSDETQDGANRPLVGATYTAYLISLKVQSQTHGEYNSAPVEYFDYWIYVNNSSTCDAVKTSLSSWLNTLNRASSTTGRAGVIGTNAASASLMVDYAAAYVAWTVPQRLVYASPNLSTGVESITTIATTAITGM